MIGRYVFDLIAEADHEQVRHHADSIVQEQGSLRNVEHTMVRRDGTSFPAEISISLLHDANGEPTGFIAAARDISSRKRSAEILLAKEVAEQASQAKSEFLSRMSHELRTPLNAIMGFAHVLQMESSDLGPDHQESIDHIAGAARHLLHLINQVLDITHVESGQLHLVIARLPIIDVVQAAFDSVQPLAQEHGVVLQTTLPVNGDLAVLADEQRVVQVLLSLLANAIIYNQPQGTVSVRYGEREEVVRIEVIDTGIGIPAAKLDRLFTPFDCLDAEYTTIEGSGLGLALVKRLVEGMHGRVGVVSVVGQGSTFVFLRATDTRTG